ncbi:MAG: DoxX family protein [Candidatus Woesearchaeota archaeon]
MKIRNDYITLLLRIGLGVVLIYFGFLNITAPETYMSFVPEQLTRYVAAIFLMQINGVVEILFGLFLIGGLYRRIVAVLVGLHILGIAFLMWSVAPDISARDFGLALAAFALSMMNEDKHSLDKKWREKVFAEKKQL